VFVSNVNLIFSNTLSNIKDRCPLVVCYYSINLIGIGTGLGVFIFTVSFFVPSSLPPMLQLIKIEIMTALKSKSHPQRQSVKPVTKFIHSVEEAKRDAMDTDKTKALNDYCSSYF
jgi:hypothetical protein